MNFWDLIFPPRCAVCGLILRQGALCAACRGKIVLRESFFCADCRARLPAGQPEMPAPCHPRPIAALGIAADYAGPIAALVRSAKFDCVRAAAAELGGLLSAYVNARPADWSGFTVLPVPLHPRRQKERGFNQAEIAARQVAGALRLPLETALLARIRPTRAQSLMDSAAARGKNLAGAFRAAELLGGRKILLIDDVVTSGATLAAAAAALKEAGAGRVIALAAAG